MDQLGHELVCILNASIAGSNLTGYAAMPTPRDLFFTIHFQEKDHESIMNLVSTTFLTGLSYLLTVSSDDEKNPETLCNL